MCTWTWLDRETNGNQGKSSEIDHKGMRKKLMINSYDKSSFSIQQRKESHEKKEEKKKVGYILHSIHQDKLQKDQRLNVK